MLARILGSFALMATSLFCVFGFLASFEPGNGSLWKIGYGTRACGWACVNGLFFALTPGPLSSMAAANSVAPLAHEFNSARLVSELVVQLRQ
jgi:hypothetical protein